MQLIHQSRSLLYRNPYGAVPAGSQVTLAISADSSDQSIQAICLCYAYGLERFRESRIRMNTVEPPAEQAMGRWQVSLRLPDEPGLFFYWFEIDRKHDRLFFTSDLDSLSGQGRLSSSRPHFHPGEPRDPAAWQITLYQPDFQVPDWLIGTVIYQIFPDRFNRDRNFQLQRFREQPYPERIYHEDWDEDVDFRGKPDTGYLACDFYGGSLAGIQERLDELVELGTRVIYLNPIFKARSNHRYDTGDYEQIDPLMGTEADFTALCRTAGQCGIRIILDGVFSHTGADSRYFNKLERYEGIGAYQEAVGKGRSPYSSWYGFQRRGDQLYYDSWWGFQDLPSVNEYDLDYQAYITGEQGIVRRWLRLGAAGWRLDVSDELPDLFLRSIRRASRAEKDDAVLLGEVWEDASCKISYGHYRDFLFGRTHDHVMGYPFQQALTGWLAGHFPAERLAQQLEQIREHYPLPVFYSNFNLISSHDIPRAITTMAGKADPGDREKQAAVRLTQQERARGEKLLCLAFFFQIIYPGAAVIYYGDELGMEGYRDPFNRRTYPQNVPGDSALLRWFRRLGPLRGQWPVLRSGFFQFVQAEKDLVVIRRWLENGKDVFNRQQPGPAQLLAALNRSDQPLRLDLDNHQITLPPYGMFLSADGQPVEL